MVESAGDEKKYERYRGTLSIVPETKMKKKIIVKACVETLIRWSVGWIHRTFKTNR